MIPPFFFQVKSFFVLKNYVRVINCMNKQQDLYVLLDELTEEDKIIVGRARRIARFLSQPFFVAETFTNIPGQYVKLDDTVESFERMVNGEFDHLPEQAFYMQGGIESVITEGERLAAEG